MLKRVWNGGIIGIRKVKEDNMIKEIKFLGFTRDNKCFSKTLFDEYSKERRIQSLINDEPIPSIIEGATDNWIISFHYSNGKYIPFKYWINDIANYNDVYAIMNYLHKYHEKFLNL